MKLEKRSLRISGHRTSVALEPEFWAAVEDMARVRGVSVPVLCAIVDQATREGSHVACVRASRASPHLRSRSSASEGRMMDPSILAFALFCIICGLGFAGACK